MALALKLTLTLIAASLHHQQARPTVHYGPLQQHRETVYSGPCDGQSNRMADATTIDAAGGLHHDGKRVDSHVLASSFLPLGTRIQFTRRVFGARMWTVRDSGGEFDLYRPGCDYGGWPGLQNLTLSYRVLE